MLMQQLADYAIREQTSKLPAEVIHHAKRAVIDWYASIYPGLDTPAVQVLMQTLADDLDRRVGQVAHRIRQDGVTHNVFADTGPAVRPWSLELLPLLIDPVDWATIEAGVLQRAALLEAVLAAQPAWASHGQPNIDLAFKAAEEAGLHLQQARADAAKPEVDAVLQQGRGAFVELQALFGPELGAVPALLDVAQELGEHQAASSGSRTYRSISSGPMMISAAVGS